MYKCSKIKSEYRYLSQSKNILNKTVVMILIVHLEHVVYSYKELS